MDLATALHGCGAAAALLIGLHTGTAAPVCGAICAALSAVEHFTSSPQLLARYWLPDSTPAYPFGPARLPALMRFIAAVLALGGAVLVVLEIIVHSAFSSSEDDSVAVAIWPAGVALAASSLGARWAAAGRGFPSGSARIGRDRSGPAAPLPRHPLATGALLLAGWPLGDTLPALALLTLAARDAHRLLRRDAPLLMQSVGNASNAARCEGLMVRAAALPGVGAAYDGCFWDLDDRSGGGGAVGALRCALRAGASAVSILEHVHALAADTPVAHLTVHLEGDG